ncbi:MAG: transcription antitermination factor NusB [Gemmatimonadota bacterium]
MSGHARSRSRSWALTLLYGWELSEGDASPTEFAIEALTRRRMAPRYRAYAMTLLETVEGHQAEIDRIMTEHAANWRLDRIGVIDRNILRIGISELRWPDNVPPKVAIHEAVRLATRYGGAESTRFVNGVLDAVYKEVPPAE